MKSIKPNEIRIEKKIKSKSIPNQMLIASLLESNPNQLQAKSDPNHEQDEFL